MKLIKPCLLAAALLSSNLYAAEAEKAELQMRVTYAHRYVTINPDGSFVSVEETRLKVLDKRAIEGAKRSESTYSVSVERVEIEEAYNLKPDGRRIDVPKDNYQVETNTGREKGAPVFSDEASLTVIYPDVEVGDTLVLKRKRTDIEPMFPNQFSDADEFGKSVAFDDMHVTYDFPASMPMQYQARGVLQSVSEKDGRKIVEFSYANPEPLKEERTDWSIYDPEEETGYAISTFHSYAEVAQAYGVRAEPKAAVTERVQKLADEIAKDKTAPREVARSLYEWVAKNITYGGNCVGVGAVVPHDIDFVLDNKMGDCKDHATLLEALLKAKGITNTQALINAGSTYTLAKIPSVGMVNHVINYIPSFDLFVDSTSDDTPFGMLPSSDQDKPILLVDGYKEGMRTPAPAAEENWQSVKTDITIKPDGAFSADIDVSVKGHTAVSMRSSMRNIGKQQEADIIKNTLKRMGRIGDGKFVKDDPTELTNTYHYHADMAADQLITWPGSGAFTINPLFMQPASMYSMTAPLYQPASTHEILCAGGVLKEEYVVHLPPKMKVLARPDDLSFTDQFVSYKASYALKNNVLTVKRELHDNVKGNRCSVEQSEVYRRVAAKISRDLKAQVVYK